jgi:hypothetical protein
MGHIEKNMIQGIGFSETSRHHKKRGRDFHLIFERGKKAELFFFGLFICFDYAVNRKML